MKKFVWGCLLLLSVFIPNLNAQQIIAPGTSEFSLNASAGGAGTNGTVWAMPVPATIVSWQISYSSAPSSAIITLQGSFDNVTYFNLDTSTNTAGEIRTLNFSTKFARCNITAQTGGGTVNCIISVKALQGITPASVSQSGNIAHGTEGDLQQPTSGPYTLNANFTSLPIISQTTGGVDRTISNNYEAFQFTTPSTLNQIGYVGFRCKFASTPTNASFIVGYLYSDSGGKPNANISPLGTGTSGANGGSNYFINAATSSYATIPAGLCFYRLNSAITPSTKYWVVTQQAVMSGGTAVIDTNNNTATGIYATNNIDSVSVLPSGGTNWTLVNNVQPYYIWYGDSPIALNGFSSNYRGVQGSSINGFGVRGDTETGLGGYFKSRHGFGVGATSVFGISGGFHSVFNFGSQSVSDVGAGSQVLGASAGEQVLCSVGGCIAIQAIAGTGAGGVLIQGLNSSFAQKFILDTTGAMATGDATLGTSQIGSIYPGSVAFATLSGSATNGQLVYCNNCAKASNPCTGSSTGTIAMRLNGSWICF